MPAGHHRRLKGITRVCRYCQQAFQLRQESQSFCGARCRMAWHQDHYDEQVILKILRSGSLEQYKAENRQNILKGTNRKGDWMKAFWERYWAGRKADLIKSGVADDVADGVEGADGAERAEGLAEGPDSPSLHASPSGPVEGLPGIRPVQ